MTALTGILLGAGCASLAWAIVFERLERRHARAVELLRLAVLRSERESAAASARADALDFRRVIDATVGARTVEEPDDEPGPESYGV